MDKGLVIVILFRIFGCLAIPNISANSTTIPQNRIVGGSCANTNKFSYDVKLIIDNERYCSGSLITAKFVLTAGHCVFEAYSVHVSIGLKSPYKIFKYLESIKFLAHEKYSPFDLGIYDIALVELPYSITLGHGIETVNLPSKLDENCTYVGSTAIQSGWGDRALNQKSHRLKFLKVLIIPANECYFIVKPSQMICGLGKDRGSACGGDSGSPLVIQYQNKKATQIGITSFASTDCIMGYPTVYSRVTKFLDWIERNSDYKF